MQLMHFAKYHDINRFVCIHFIELHKSQLNSVSFDFATPTKTNTNSNHGSDNRKQKDKQI